MAIALSDGAPDFEVLTAIDATKFVDRHRLLGIN